MIGDTIRSADDELRENDKGLIARAEILRRWNVRDKHILDIGAGPLSIIAAREFNCTVTTIDVSEDKLREVTHDVGLEGLGAQIIVEHGDATALSYPDRSFEVVIIYGTLHHIEPLKRTQCIHEVARVTKELVIIAELNADGFRTIHEFDEFTPVDLDWLERAMHPLGGVEKYQGRLMNVYALPFGYGRTDTKKE
jgi:ubiquinone/menaquinone biosynthesis C-methylase UbiE